MAKTGKHAADITDPVVAIAYWRARAKQQGSGYVSRGGKNSGTQVKVLKPVFNTLLKGMKFKQGLDYGCGGGRFTALMACRCEKVLGVDPVGCFNKVRPRNVTFYQLNHPIKIPLANNSVDLLFLIMVFQHITGDVWFEYITKEIRRVLASGATVLIVDDITGTANHMRPRTRKELCKSLGVTTALKPVELAIDSDGMHQLIFGRAEG